MMRRVVAVAVVVGLMGVMSQMLAAADSAAKTGTDATKAKAAAKAKAVTPADRVVVMYFHRTQRCPTCRRMGAYSEEAVKKGFAKDVKKGVVEFHYIDFQDEKNAAYAKGYKVTGPTLVVAQIVGNKVKGYKNLEEIWEKNGDKDEFLKYVRDNVVAYQKSMPKKTQKDAGKTPAKAK
jgi:thiol-disulfide isomerase/thioredoxin